ncbi:MAG: hypothetical protein R2864_13065 [Syntrophotaleaceae bacterium]
MDKRFIGIDIDRGWVRLAVAVDTADGPQLVATDKRPWTDPPNCAKRCAN